MWHKNWREQTWQNIQQPWDVLVIGGGITGAGVLRAAVRAGLKTLLVDANDFTFGTSSRSSKLVHGGFRYLRNGQFSVTRQAVCEREWLLRAAPDLVLPLCFVMPRYTNCHTPAWQLGLGVLLYDLLAPKWAHRNFSAAETLRICPQLNPRGLDRGFEYGDAAVDDCRLVLRLLGEACRAGGTALNYARVEALLRRADGSVCGAALRDTSRAEGGTVEVQARAVVNAAGPWCDELRALAGEAAPRLRKLRGSHLVFSRARLPLPCAVTLLHPRDNRAMFAIPWEGVTLIGTTDLDHDPALEAAQPEPRASAEEIHYLLEAARVTFAPQRLSEADILTTFAGLRPTVRGSSAAPSKVSRQHVVWQEQGLLTVTSGKLTTFRVMALEALNALRAQLPGPPDFDPRQRFFETLPELPEVDLTAEMLAYLMGRYGAEAGELLACAAPGELEPIPGAPNPWAELRWAARCGGGLHLDDLLLRRLRLGLLLPGGGLELLPRIRAVVQPEMGWDDARWAVEEAAYRRTWAESYGMPV